MRKRKSRRKGSHGIVKVTNFVKRQPKVKSADKRIRKLETKLNAEKRKKAKAKKEAIKKWHRKHC